MFRYAGASSRRRLIVLVAAVSAVVLGLLTIGFAAVGVVTTVRSTDLASRLPHPWRPSAAALFPAATTCADCHPTQVQAWQVSTHARSVYDPLVHASICGRCHAPLGTQLDPEYQLKEYDGVAMPAMPSSATEGVTCITCHTTVHEPEQQVLTFLPVWPNWRTTDLALVFQPFETALGTFGSGSADDPPPVANDSHPSLADPRLSSAELCRPCHNVVVDKGPLTPHCGFGESRVLLLTTYDEWAASPYPEVGRTCQSCHMARDQELGAAAVAPPGTEYASPLPERPLANHTITGVSSEYLTSGPQVDEEEARVASWVKGAADVSLDLPGSASISDTITIAVAMTNVGAGHDLPTGFAYWSEAWLEVIATDAEGHAWYKSGDVDGEGWLRDEFNPRVKDGSLEYDADLVSLRARLVTVGPNAVRWLQPDGTIRIPDDEVPRNHNGTPIIGLGDEAVDAIIRDVYGDRPPPPAASSLREGYVLRFADTIVRNGIPAQQTRWARYRVTVPASTAGSIRVSARLLIRELWPWMLLQQEELPTPRPRPRVYEIASANGTVAIAQPRP